MKNSQIEFSTREFRWEHGKDPKGYGYWGFTFEGYEFWASGTYAQAKKACVNEVKRLAPTDYVGHVTVNVLP